jgi:hypothetical protein
MACRRKPNRQLGHAHLAKVHIMNLADLCVAATFGACADRPGVKR